MIMDELEYFKNFQDGDNITITADFIDNAENLCYKYKKVLDDLIKADKENERLKSIIESDEEDYDIQETIINRQKMKILELESQLERVIHCCGELQGNDKK